jgi:hypothetical protein
VVVLEPQEVRDYVVRRLQEAARGNQGAGR